MNHFPPMYLDGITLKNDWVIISSFTGYQGQFGRGYIAENKQTNKKGFVKALNLEILNNSQNFLVDAQKLINDFSFEQNLLKQCLNKRMSRVVKLLDYGEIKSEKFSLPIPYMIFEFAEKITKEVLETDQRSLDSILQLSCIHGAITAVNQLHKSNIAHQDIKPSNFLEINDITKIADLGRSTQINNSSSYDEINVAGDQRYSPPELLYGEVSNDWYTRRFSCDMYMLGGIIAYCITHEPLTYTLIKNLNEELKPLNMQGQYDQVLPSIQSEMNKIYTELEIRLPENLKEIVIIIKQMTNPDPSYRGWPKFKGRVGNQYNLEPYISQIANLLKKIEYKFDKC